MAKKIPIQVIVSIPRSGEFITTVNLDPNDWMLMNAPNTRDVTDYALDLVMANLRVKPMKGETQKVLKSLRARGKGR